MPSRTAKTRSREPTAKKHNNCDINFMEKSKLQPNKTLNYRRPMGKQISNQLLQYQYSERLGSRKMNKLHSVLS